MTISSPLLATFFAATVVLAIDLFVRAGTRMKWVWTGLFVYALVQFGVAETGFYEDTTTLPPRFLLNLLPGVLAICWLFISKQGRAFRQSLDVEKLMWVHVVRVPVELVLYALFFKEQIPRIMTFSGNNFDIVMGLTAPAVWYFGYGKGMISPGLIRIWHIVGLVLLFNIVVTALLAAPFPFQQIAFQQPNVGILQAPYNLMPAIVVPLVVVAHLVGLTARSGERKV